MPLDIKLMAEICEVAGAPGYEKRIRDIVLREVTPLVDEVSVELPIAMRVRACCSSSGLIFVWLARYR